MAHPLRCRSSHRSLPLVALLWDRRRSVLKDWFPAAFDEELFALVHVPVDRFAESLPGCNIGYPWIPLTLYPASYTSAQGENRTPTPLREADFKSAASAVSPPGPHNEVYSCEERLDHSFCIPAAFRDLHPGVRHG